jgi:hypothetical protein
MFGLPLLFILLLLYYCRFPQWRRTSYTQRSPRWWEWCGCRWTATHRVSWASSFTQQRYEHIDAYAYIHLYTCIRTYLHRSIHAYIHIYVSKHLYMHACIFEEPIGMHAFIYTHMHTHTYKYTCMPTYMHTYMHTHLNKCTCIPNNSINTKNPNNLMVRRFADQRHCGVCGRRVLADCRRKCESPELPQYEQYSFFCESPELPKYEQYSLFCESPELPQYEQYSRC